mgnify:CR=1 FL=1
MAEVAAEKKNRTELIVAVLLAAAVIVYIALDCLRYGVKEGFDGFWERFGVGIGAICTLAVYSFLYRENPIYRFMEHILVGLSVGYMTAVVWTETMTPNWLDRLVGADGRVPNLLWILPVFPGLLWYFQLSRRHVWLSRLIIMFFMGTGSGLAFRGQFSLPLRRAGTGDPEFQTDSHHLRRRHTFHLAQLLRSRLHRGGAVRAVLLLLLVPTRAEQSAAAVEPSRTLLFDGLLRHDIRHDRAGTHVAVHRPSRIPLPRLAGPGFVSRRSGRG